MLSIKELEELIHQEQVIGTAKRRGRKTAAVLLKFTNSRIIHLEGIIARHNDPRYVFVKMARELQTLTEASFLPKVVPV